MQPQPAPAVYVAGTVVKTAMSFVDENGDPGDPDSVTCTVTYGSETESPPTQGTVVQDSTGEFHCDVPTLGWTGPGLQPVFCQWLGSGGIDAQWTDQFLISPTASAGSDTTGP